MKKIFILFLVLAFAFPLMAQETDYEEGEAAAPEPEKREPVLRLSGEAKTGILWEERQDAGKEKDVSQVRLHSKDDAGGNTGRFRVNFDYDNGGGIGFRARLNWEQFNDATPDWSYGFGYGNFFKNQLTVSVGKLGGSPWGTGGPEMWKELEVSREGGMRVEWKPNFIPKKAGEFNLGFVLNYLDDPDEASVSRDASFLDILSETIIGISYTHKYAHARFAFRFDSDLDSKQRMDGKIEGGKLIYRVEERIIQKYLPGFQIWGLGYFVGVGAEEDQFYNFVNWFFVQYDASFKKAPDLFTAQVRLGYDYVASRQVVHLKPNIYFHFLNKLISVGAAFLIGFEFGNKINPDAPYQYIEVEPRLQINFQSSYIAFVYNWRRQYLTYYPEAGNLDPIRQSQYMNLRFCIYF